MTVNKADVVFKDPYTTKSLHTTSGRPIIWYQQYNVYIHAFVCTYVHMYVGALKLVLKSRFAGDKLLCCPPHIINNCVRSVVRFYNRCLWKEIKLVTLEPSKSNMKLD